MAELDAPPTRLAELQESLSADERERAGRFRQPRDRAWFIQRRAMLRAGLARLAGVAPDRIRFAYGPTGKPHMLEPRSARGVEFSLAHSAELAVFACTEGSAIGIDVERVCQHDHLLDVAEVCFSPRERRTLAGLPPAVQTAAFYRCWTRKEAYVKALGTGLGSALQDFDVALRPGERPAVLRVKSHPFERTRWRMQSLAVPAEFVGALAIRGRGLRIRQLSNVTPETDATP
jgi:4'-phosphopantetheinyl transferase